MLGGRHPYPHGPFLGHHHPHFPPQMFAAALDRPLNTSPRITNEPSSTSLGPISITCSNSAHSTTSPRTSPSPQTGGLLTTTTAAGDPHSPAQEDDISVTASPTPSPQPSPAFPTGIAPTPHLFNSALAASLLLNNPLLPPPGQWFYSQLYPHDWSWMQGLRSNAALARCVPQDDSSQNPDSSSEKLDVTEVDDDDKDVKKEDAEQSEGINLSLKVRKAAITLVKQKDEVSSTDRDAVKGRDASRSVWRPY